MVDRLADRLTRAARRQCANPTAFIADRDLFGDLADDERFVTADGRYSDDETLFMPLSDDGETVNKILVYGTFTRRPGK